MIRCIGLAVVAAVAAQLCAAEPATRPAQEELKFLRFVDDGQGGGRLETANVTFAGRDGVTVQLVSAVHIGEGAYFAELSRGFKERDAVLYELVKPAEGVGPTTRRASDSAVSQIQMLMKELLNLEFQLDQIDYTPANFVHADLDSATFAKLQAERGESIEMLIFRSVLRSLTDTPPAQAADPEQMLRDALNLLLKPDMERQIKLLLAKQMTDLEKAVADLEGPNGSVILTERNKHAMKVLEKTIKDGKKDIAIFYGAAHMPDLAGRLAAMGYAPVKRDWVVAWDLKIRANRPSALQRLIEELMRAMEQ